MRGWKVLEIWRILPTSMSFNPVIEFWSLNIKNLDFEKRMDKSRIDNFKDGMLTEKMPLLNKFAIASARL